MRRTFSTLSFVMVFMVCSSSLVFGMSPERSAKNSIWAEGLGAGLLYSLNYERLVINDLGVRVGISYLSYGAEVSTGSADVSSKASFTQIPITANYIGISNGTHSLELGVGPTLAFASGSSSAGMLSAEGSGMIFLINTIVGYRIQPVNGGFQFRVGFNGIAGPGLGFDIENPTDPTAWGYLPWFHISLGGSF